MGPVWAPTSVQNGANKPYLLPFYATILPFLPPSGRSRSPLTIYQTVSLGNRVNKAAGAAPCRPGVPGLGRRTAVAADPLRVDVFREKDSYEVRASVQSR